MKAQINLEFLASAGLYLMAIGGIMIAGSDTLPFNNQDDRASLHLEAKSMTNKILSDPGEHSYGAGGNNWEQNSSTINNISSFGLATSFLEVDREKLENIATTSINGPERFNYTQFKEVTGAENQYRFRFTWMPVVHTDKSFTRSNPPSNPDITEPCQPGETCDRPYLEADNKVHYGSVTLKGTTYYFLNTAHNGVYNTTYITTDRWNFENAFAYGTGDSYDFFNVESFQNRDRDEGSILVLSENVKTFGANIDSNAVVVKMQRFASMNNEPLRIEVWVW